MFIKARIVAVDMRWAGYDTCMIILGDEEGRETVWADPYGRPLWFSEKDARAQIPLGIELAPEVSRVCLVCWGTKYVGALLKPCDACARHA